jgi:hypothetical protein
MRGLQFRSTAAWVLGLMVLAGCDLSPTSLDALDSSSVERLIRAAAERDPDPAHRVLYQLAESGADGHTSPAHLPQLDSLYELALSAQAVTDPPRAEQDRRRVRVMTDDAWSAIARGETSDGDRRLVSVRRFQAETVVRVFGAPTAALYQTLLERTIRDATHQLGTNPPDEGTPTLEAMIATIRELQMDARQAWAAGDAATSVDIATHAAGLANTLSRRLTER